MSEQSTKELMIQLIAQLPEDATVEDAFDRLYLLYKIERGIGQADAGHKSSQEEARQQMKRWLG